MSAIFIPATAPPALGPGIGISFGTGYACVSVYRNDIAEVIANEIGNKSTPCFVAFTDEEGGRLVGDAAKNQRVRNPRNTIYDIKRFIGRRFDDPEVQTWVKQEKYPFRIVGNDKNRILFEVEEGGQMKQYLPEELVGMIFRHMKGIAETYLGQPVQNAVVTVPAYFHDFSRTAMKDAGAIAGLNILRIINEPTAAGIAYGLDRRPVLPRPSGEYQAIIFDLGANSVDVTAMVVEDGVYEVRATGGNSNLGGDQFDERLVEYLTSQFQKQTGKTVESARSLSRLRRAAERAKIALSLSMEAQIEVEGFHEGLDFQTSVTRALFEELNLNYFHQCVGYVDQLVRDAHLTREDVDGVLIIGGGSHIPRLQAMLTSYFGRDVTCTITPEEASARGAAIQAFILSESSRSHNWNCCLIQDITPLSLSVESSGGTMTQVIPRNSSIPCRKQSLFTTHRDNQRSIEIRVFEGERLLARDNNLLSSFTIAVPPLPKGVLKFDVTFELDVNGILTVSCKESTMGLMEKRVITNDQGRLSAQEINDMINNSEKYKAEDEAHYLYLRALVPVARDELNVHVIPPLNAIIIEYLDELDTMQLRQIDPCCCHSSNAIRVDELD